MYAYIRLMRLHKPIGILLLWFPAAFALWIANQGGPSLSLVIYFLLGTIIMRTAGCVLNDIVDRKVDRHVRRTSTRPITTGEVSVTAAFIVLTSLLLVALIIVMQLPFECFYYALVGLALTIVYPFCKRWIEAPQLVLGIAFSVAIPMVYVASGVQFDVNMMILLLINILWVIAYDTFYAMVDREDDLKIGVKSTAILLGSSDVMILGILQIVMHGLWLVIADHLPHAGYFYVGWGLGCLVLMYQQILIVHRKPEACFRAFHWSVLYGFIMWMSLMQSANPWFSITPQA